MVLERVFERFVEKAPVSVMFRGLLENALPEEEVDRLFLEQAQTGYLRSLLFSQVVELTGLMVARIQPSIRAAFEECKPQLGVRLDSVYDKLQRLEPRVVAALVQHVAGKLSAVIDQMPGSCLPPVFPGHRTRILDGKHLDGTQRRLKPLRKFNSVPLPGQLLVVLDAERRLATDVVPCEDAYAQERALVERVLPAVEAGDVWIEDRNFCTTRFLFSVAGRGGYFLVRRHASTLYLEAQGAWQAAGRTETGQVFEARWQIGDGEGQSMTVRAVRICLDRPTRDGDREIVLLTNLPPEVSALDVARGYLQRWTIEAAFGEIATLLQAEVNTMGYPKAALFCFAVGLITYNLLSTLKGALRAVHGTEKVQNEFSAYYLALRIRNTWEGLEIAIEDASWREAFAFLSAPQLAAILLELAARVNLDRFPKSARGPKKKVKRRTNGGRYRHLSTARLLAGDNPFGKTKSKSSKQC